LCYFLTYSSCVKLTKIWVDTFGTYETC